MGYALEFHAVNFATLGTVLGSRDTAAWGRAMAAEADNTLADGTGVSWRHALDDLIFGERGQMLAQRGPLAPEVEEASDEEAQALVNLVRAQDELLGQVVHTTRGGEAFRALFAPDHLPASFSQPRLLRLLLHRPLFGLGGDPYPDWGGLRKDELGALLSGVDPSAAFRNPDPDERDWLEQIRALLWDAHDSGCDLVTLYL